MKKIVFGIIIGLSLGLSLSSVASGVWEKIDVLRNDIQVVVNGVPVESDNFLYNDTTYLPLRAVGEAIGVDVLYNEETNTAILSERIDDMNEPIEPSVSTGGYEVPVYTNGFAGDLGYPYVSVWDVDEYAESIGLRRVYIIRNDSDGITKALSEYYNDELGVPKIRVLIEEMPGYGSAIRYDYWINTLKPFLDNLAAQRNQE